MDNPLKRKVNFYVSIGLIASFGFLMTVSLVQAINKNSLLVAYISSPIEFEYDIEAY